MPICLKTQQSCLAICTTFLVRTPIFETNPLVVMNLIYTTRIVLNRDKWNVGDNLWQVQPTVNLMFNQAVMEYYEPERLLWTPSVMLTLFPKMTHLVKIPPAHYQWVCNNCIYCHSMSALDNASSFNLVQQYHLNEFIHWQRKIGVLVKNGMITVTRLHKKYNILGKTEFLKVKFLDICCLGVKKI